MLPLDLFSRRNFTFGNIQTFAMYGGLGAMFFFLTLFLQQVAGYEALEAGIATIPTTLVMFALSKRAGRLADRFGPRFFMGFGPLVSAVGIALMLRLDEDISYWTELFPALLIFSLGLVATVTPLTATVLADADERNAGIASGVNNAIARVAGLLAIAVLGAFVTARFSTVVDERLGDRPLSAAAQAAVAEAKDRSLTTAPAARVPPAERATVRAALEDGSESAFHLGLGIGALLVLSGGVVSLVGIRNPTRSVPCEDCPGGALVGAPEDLARVPEPAAA
jgi:MFS family permease